MFGRPGAGGVDPRTFQSLALWIAADRIDALPDSTALQTWPDLSNRRNSPTQPTGSLQGLYRARGGAGPNGMPYVQYDGVDDLHVTPNIINPAGAVSISGTQIMVVRYRTSTGGQTWPNGPNPGFVSNAGPGQICVTAGATLFSGFTPVVGTWYIFSHVYRQGVNTGDIYVNGGDLGVATGANGGNGFNSTMGIGARSDAVNFGPYDIAEYMIFLEVMAASQRVAFEQGLARKYNILSALNKSIA